jgi:hypothetical protein
MIIKRVLGVASGLALTAGFALSALPSQAITVPPGDDIEAGWTWSISNPARYDAGPHEAVVGLSDATRTVTIEANGTAQPEAGDKWRVYNGYFSAEGVFTAAEAAAGKDTDSVKVEVPSSNSVAGDDLAVHLKVSDPDTAGWEVDKSSSVAPLNILRRTEFKSGSSADRVNFSPEPYVDTVKASGKLVRASWSSGQYVGYEGRNIHIQTRTDAGVYGDVGEISTGAGGAFVFTFKVSDPGAPAPGDPFIGRGLYGGNGTSSGTVSTGDRVVAATS